MKLHSLNTTRQTSTGEFPVNSQETPLSNNLFNHSYGTQGGHAEAGSSRDVQQPRLGNNQRESSQNPQEIMKKAREMMGKVEEMMGQAQEMMVRVEGDKQKIKESLIFGMMCKIL